MFFDKKVVFSVLGGFALGKVGGLVLGSDTAKKAYVKATTLGMILKDYTMETTENIQAAASDIAAEAREEADKYQAKRDAACGAGWTDDSDSVDFIDSEEDLSDSDFVDESETAEA